MQVFFVKSHWLSGHTENEVSRNAKCIQPQFVALFCRMYNLSAWEIQVTSLMELLIKLLVHRMLRLALDCRKLSEPKFA